MSNENLNQLILQVKDVHFDLKLFFRLFIVLCVGNFCFCKGTVTLTPHKRYRHISEPEAITETVTININVTY